MFVIEIRSDRMPIEEGLTPKEELLKIAENTGYASLVAVAELFGINIDFGKSAILRGWTIEQIRNEFVKCKTSISKDNVPFTIYTLPDPCRLESVSTLSQSYNRKEESKMYTIYRKEIPASEVFDALKAGHEVLFIDLELAMSVNKPAAEKLSLKSVSRILEIVENDCDYFMFIDVLYACDEELEEGDQNDEEE